MLKEIVRIVLNFGCDPCKLHEQPNGLKENLENWNSGKVDSAINWINNYPADNAISFFLTLNNRGITFNKSFLTF